MVLARISSETRPGEVYQAYGLNGRFEESFDFEELLRLFEAKYGYQAKEAMVTAGGGTALLGPVRSMGTMSTDE